MEDTYLPAFRATVTEGKAGSIMCAYNRVNGQPACASDFLLVDQLRDKWKFNGYVVSDCDAVADIFNGHKSTKNMAEAAGLTVKIAREMIVLMKNDGTLPLKDSVKKIAVLGPLAESARVLEGNYNGTPSHSTTALAGIRQQFPSADVTYAPGMNFLRTEEVI